MVSQFRYLTLKERVYKDLLELIVAGDIPLGSQIDEREIAQKLSVSRTPLREAIGTLAKEGLVEYRPYRGNFVRSFTAEEVDDLYEVRKVLEGLAVRLAVKRLSDQDVEDLAAILDELETALEQNDLDLFSAADRRFHEAIAALSGNATLIDSLNRLGLQVRILRYVANRDAEVIRRTALERPRILAALRARDAELAAGLMEAHIEGVRRSVVAQIEARESEGGNL